MILQVPGSFIFMYTLAVRPGTNFTTWITFLATGILQATLLGICLYFHFCLKKKRHDFVEILPEDGGEEGIGEEQDIEEAEVEPLLPAAEDNVEKSPSHPEHRSQTTTVEIRQN